MPRINLRFIEFNEVEDLGHCSERTIGTMNVASSSETIWSKWYDY